MSATSCAWLGFSFDGENLSPWVRFCFSHLAHVFPWDAKPLRKNGVESKRIKEGGRRDGHSGFGDNRDARVRVLRMPPS
jgi:hypothetical protein